MALRKKKEMNVSRMDGLIGPGGNSLRRGSEMHLEPLPAHAQSGSSRPGKSTDPPALDLSRSASRAMAMDEGATISNPSEFRPGAINMGPPSTPVAMNLTSSNFPHQNFLPEQPNWNPNQSGFSYSQPNYLGSYGNSPYYGYTWPYSCMPFGYYPNVQQPNPWSMSWNPGQFGAIAAQTSPKTYPVVPQPIYPNGQAYAGLGSYQYLAACQSFSSTVGPNFQANQYWKYGSWPQQPQRFVYQSIANAPAGVITESGSRYPNPMPNDFYPTTLQPQESNEPTVEFPSDSSAETNTSSFIEEQGSVPFRSPLPPMLTPPASDTNGDTTVDVTRVFDTPRNSRSEGSLAKESQDTGGGQRRKQARPRRADGESTADDAEQNVDVENPKKRARRRKPNKPEDESSCPTPYKLRSGNARVIPAKPKGRPRKAKGDSNQNVSKRKKAHQTSDEMTQIVPPESLMLNNDGSFDRNSIEAQFILHRTKEWKLNSLDGETVLHRAASLGLADFVQCILKLGLVSSPNCVNSNGLTPLHEACAQGHEQAARILLTNGAGPNKASISGLRPLHLVQQNGHEGLVKLLIEYGAEQVV